MPAPREGGECSRAQDEVYAFYGYLVAEPGTVICLLGGSHRRLKAPQQGLSVVREPPKFPESSQTLSNLLCLAGVSSGKARTPSGGGCGSCSGCRHGHAWHVHVLQVMLVDVQMKTLVP